MTVRFVRASDVPLESFPDPDLPAWSVWRLNAADLTLETGPPRGYYVDLERCRSSAEVLDWICQVSGKRWATPTVVGGLVVALDWVLRPQATLCSFGRSTTLTTAEIRARVRSAVAAHPETTRRP